MTQRQLHLQSPPSMGQLTKLGTWRNSTACRWLNRLENVLSRCLSWSNLLPDSWFEVGSSESLFAAQLPFNWLGLSAFIALWQGRGLMSLVSFRDLSAIFRVAFLPEELPFRANEGWNSWVSILEEISTSGTTSWRINALFYKGSIHHPRRRNKICHCQQNPLKKS